MQDIIPESIHENLLLVNPIGVFEMEGTHHRGPQLSSERNRLTPFGTIRSFKFEHLHCHIFNLRGATGQRTVFQIRRAACIQLVYVLKGACSWCVEGGEDVKRFIPSEYHSSAFFPAGSSGSLVFVAPSETMVMVVHVAFDFFMDYLTPTSPVYPVLSRYVSFSSVSLLDQEAIPTTPYQSAALYSMVSRRRHASMRHHYMNAKLNVLLVLYLEQRMQFSEKEHVALRDEELQRVYRVRDILLHQPGKSYTLVGLAHEVGTNDATLKKHFKQVFNTTVFDYLTSCRMELAKTLLLKNNQKVAAVAQEVGYKYASHFSTAFRKYFGYLPNKLLRSMVFTAFLSESSFPILLLQHHAAVYSFL